MTASPWGPFTAGIDPAERRAQLRTLRALVKVMLGPRGQVAALALLRAEISEGDPELLAEAASAFEALAPIDRRRVLSSFAGSLPTRIAS